MQYHRVIDTSPVIYKTVQKIENTKKVYTVQTIILQKSGFNLIQLLPLILNNLHKSKEQDHSQAIYYRQDNPDHGLLHFKLEDYAIFILIRALVFPWIGAHHIDKNTNFEINNKFLSMKEIPISLKQEIRET